LRTVAKPNPVVDFSSPISASIGPKAQYGCKM
jgi:hypothetical protein